MNRVEQIFERIKSARFESQIAVELVENKNKTELRSYFANCLPAPSVIIAKTHEGEKILGANGSRFMMPFRNPRTQIGNFYGAADIDRLKKYLEDIGFDFENAQ